MFEYLIHCACRTVDSLALGYGTGKLTCFLGNLNGIVDLVYLYHYMQMRDDFGVFLWF